MSIRLNKALRVLKISLSEATSVLKDRNDIGEFRDNFSWKITFEQFNLLVEYAKNVKEDFDDIIIDEFLKTRDNSLLKKSLSKQSDGMENNLIRDIDGRAEIKNNIINEKVLQNGPKIFRHKRPKIIAIKNDGSLILETSPYGFLYKKDCVKFNYKDNELSLYANGVSPILNEYTQEIVKIFPVVRIKIGGNNKFHFINPKFYNFITDLCFKIKKEKRQDKRGKKELNELSSKQKLEVLADAQNTILFDPPIKNNEEIREQFLSTDNLEFFDYYYKIWVVGGDKVKLVDISPYVIKDNNSRACFNVLNKYLSNRMPGNIIIRYSNKSIINVDKCLMLSAYIKILQENILLRGDWEYELSNFRKRTLRDCMNISLKKINSDISYKSIYIDYLASNQSEKQLIKAYEVFNGIEEDCFIFTIKMTEDLSAIIFENVLFARASEIFIVHEKDYVKCINQIFNYFTDYELRQKRLAFKCKLIEAEKFCAVKYETVDHDNLSTWINKIKNIISNIEKKKENIQFVYGLKLSKDSFVRNIQKGTTTNVSRNHKDLMIKLFSKLVKIYGEENVGTEISVGRKRIDVAVKNGNLYDIY